MKVNLSTYDKGYRYTKYLLASAYLPATSTKNTVTIDISGVKESGYIWFVLWVESEPANQQFTALLSNKHPRKRMFFLKNHI